MITFAQSKNSALHRLTAIYNAFLYRFCGAEIVRTDVDGLPKITQFLKNPIKLVDSKVIYVNYYIKQIT